MTAIGSATTLNQQLYMRLFDKLDVDKSDGLSAAELSAGLRSDAKAEKAFSRLDADGDGRVSRTEMTPSSRFGGDMLSALLAVQAEPETGASRAEILADLFERADLNGDGALDAEEMKAEQSARRAANLDAGYMAGPIFIPRDGNRDGLLTMEEIDVGQSGQILSLPSSAVHFFDELEPEQQARFDAMRKEQGLPPAPRYTAEEKQAIRDQMDADRAERASGPAGTTRFLAQELDALRAGASTEFGAVELSGALAQRLLNQILDPSWSTTA